jgi:tetratricopeptide (TPR) repeat protein
LEDDDNALKHYKLALKIDSEYPDALFGMAIVLERKGMDFESSGYIKKAISFDEANPDFWHFYGDLLLKTGFVPDAEFAYAKTVTLSPENVDAWIDLAHLRFEHESQIAGFETVAEGIKTNPGAVELYFKMAAILLAMGKQNDAFEVLRTAMEIDAGRFQLLFDFYPDAAKIPAVIDFVEAYK